MALLHIHVCYRIMDPEKTTDFYEQAMQKVGEAILRCDQLLLRHDPPSMMLELTHNHARPETHR